MKVIIEVLLVEVKFPSSHYISYLARSCITMSFSSTMHLLSSSSYSLTLSHTLSVLITLLHISNRRAKSRLILYSNIESCVRN